MASLPSVAVSTTLNLEPDFKKYSLPFDKGPSISYQRNQTTTPDVSTDPKSLDFREALSLIREGSKVESSVYVPILQECIKNNSISQARTVHTHIIKTGNFQDIFLSTFLVNVYAKCGRMEDARKVFNDLSGKNVVTWTALMTGYVHNSRPELAIQVFLEMLEAGSYPTNYTLGIILSACSWSRLIELGKQIHGYIIKYQIDFDTSVGNSLCSFYSKIGKLESAIKSFEGIREKNVISWTTLMAACGDNGESALGLGFFTEMLGEEDGPNEFTLTSALSMCCIMHSLSLGTQIHSLSIKLGYESNVQIKNSIMYLYLKCGFISEAKKLFDEMDHINLVTWNAMIAGHAQMMSSAKDDLSAYNTGMEALNIFLKLNRSGKKPDLFTLSSIFSICSSLVALEQGEQIHAQAIKSGFLSDVVVGTALVNMYNKCGSIERASKAFVEMSNRTMISWTAMITSFAQHGRSQQALQLFEDMRLAKVRPNKVTFVGVLSACSHAGMVDEAMRYFEMMKNEYKIKPVMDHYACLIDMFVRLGQLDEAFDFITRMDFKPNEFIWSSLVAGSRSHGKLELAYYAAEKLLELKPKDTETYVMILSMYLTAGRFKDVSRVRKLMRDEKKGKLKDWSWISIKEKVYSFKPVDLFRPASKEIEEILSDLVVKAKGLGYESQVSLEVAEEENEERVVSSVSVHHSEKVAVAYGLLNTSVGFPIRVVKSVGMCKDCHSFIKFVSVLMEREIVVRDSKRLHKFVNGRCSCGDFGNLL